MGVSQVTKHLIFSFLPKGVVYDTSMIIFPFEQNISITLLQNTIHDSWARKYGSTLESRLRYTPTDCFETFPFPQNLRPNQEQQLEVIGEAYHEHRRQIMLGMQLGLTDTYNLFHCQKDFNLCKIKSGKVLFVKHLEKPPNTISFKEALQGILKLRDLHMQMDEAVLDAYGWNDIALKHDFYEVDYLPENDRIRFTIHPDARKEVLKRLLELNHKIHAEEVKAGLWDKKSAKKKEYKQNDELNKVNEPDISYGGLFDQK